MLAMFTLAHVYTSDVTKLACEGGMGPLAPSICSSEGDPLLCRALGSMRLTVTFEPATGVCVWSLVMSPHWAESRPVMNVEESRFPFT